MTARICDKCREPKPAGYPHGKSLWLCDACQEVWVRAGSNRLALQRLKEYYKSTAEPAYKARLWAWLEASWGGSIASGQGGSCADQSQVAIARVDNRA